MELLIINYEKKYIWQLTSHTSEACTRRAIPFNILTGNGYVLLSYGSKASDTWNGVAVLAWSWKADYQADQHAGTGVSIPRQVLHAGPRAARGGTDKVMSWGHILSDVDNNGKTTTQKVWLWEETGDGRHWSVCELWTDELHESLTLLSYCWVSAYTPHTFLYSTSLLSFSILSYILQFWPASEPISHVILSDNLAGGAHFSLACHTLPRPLVSKVWYIYVTTCYHMFQPYFGKDYFSIDS